MKATNGPEQSQNRGCSRQNRAQGTRTYKSHFKNLAVVLVRGRGEVMRAPWVVESKERQHYIVNKKKQILCAPQILNY